ncbi:MAG: HpcH/HpaI aldolase/citrate lyase family protein [Clostridia bacterium]|nr:HpcH/HpaI aldolase/citrate lyase family protein [Clostridia bacterium]
MNENKKRLRRSMMFMNCQRPGLIKDAYIYRPDSIMFDLEDAVSINQKDAARYSLYHTLREVDYQGIERVVRINGLDTEFWKEDVRVCVAGGADAIRIAKTERADDVRQVEAAVEAAEKEFNRPAGSTLLMAAIESARGVMNALEICEASDRLFGIALSGGDYTKDLQTTMSKSGIEMMGARHLLIIAARAAGVQCFDTVYLDLDDMDGFRREVEMDKQLGFDGKSIINPRQIEIVHQVYTPTEREIIFAEKVVHEIEDKRSKGIGVFVVDGRMIDIAFYDGAIKTLAMARAAGVYE